MDKVAFVFLVLILAAILCLMMAYPFMWIWNYAVVSALTIAKPIEYWVSFWLMSFISLFLVKSKNAK